jgi:hypothetical protein
MLEILRLLTALTVIAFGGLSLFIGVKFFRLWHLFREEAIFHLGTLSIGMLVYFFILELLIILDDIILVDLLVKKGLPIVFSILCLELSLFYLALFANRKTIWEKYIPFMFGIGFGTAIGLLGLTPDLDTWFWGLLLITYSISLTLITILTIRISFRVMSLLKGVDIQNEDDKRFLSTLVYATIFLFGGAILDIIMFTIMTFSGFEGWKDIITVGGVITAPLLLLAIWIVRKFFKNLEKANIIHVMNLLS